MSFDIFDKLIDDMLRYKKSKKLIFVTKNEIEYRYAKMMFPNSIKLIKQKSIIKEQQNAK
jgi:hypothetical protein